MRQESPSLGRYSWIIEPVGGSSPTDSHAGSSIYGVLTGPSYMGLIKIGVRHDVAG